MVILEITNSSLQDIMEDNTIAATPEQLKKIKDLVLEVMVELDMWNAVREVVHDVLG